MLCVQPLELRFEVLVALSIEHVVCRYVAPCTSLYSQGHIGGMCHLLHTLLAEAVAL
jgi:hypothetical protein